MVTVKDVVKALEELGIKKGDSILTHSSFKSLGEVENGAATVVQGFLEAVGPEGTVIFPTLCQKDWEHVYENWNLDAQSDVGYLTNYFRRLPEARRSDQATHSVAAIGKAAEYLTETHGKSGLRYGIFGDTPFSKDSPWEKMYLMDTKFIFLGVGIRKCTMRHYVEYCFMEEYLNKAKDSSKYEQLKAQVWCYDRWNDQGVWPHINNEYVLKKMEEEGNVHRALCGEAELLMVSSVQFTDLAYKLVKERDTQVFSMAPDSEGGKAMLRWLDEIDQI